MLIAIRRHAKKHKAQSTVEYGILIGVIVAAAVAMQTYIKRSLQAKQHDAADMMTSVGGDVDLGGQTATLNTNVQYEPYYLARHGEQDLENETVNKDVHAGGTAVSTRSYDTTARSAVIYRDTSDAH